MSVAYHLVARDWYVAQPDEHPYLPEGFEREGFIHLTHGIEAVIAVGNRYYRDDPRQYLLLTVDLSAVPAEIRYEDAARQFPHIHGPLDRAAILGVSPVQRDDTGAFISVDPAGQ
jgi:uncharacterized protein (DUF952 family)